MFIAPMPERIQPLRQERNVPVSDATHFARTERGAKERLRQSINILLLRSKKTFRFIHRPQQPCSDTALFHTYIKRLRRVVAKDIDDFDEHAVTAGFLMRVWV